MKVGFMGLWKHRLRSTDAAKSAPTWVMGGIKISTISYVDLLQVKTTLVLFVIYSIDGLWRGTTAAVETIKLSESEGDRENDFYWQFQLTLRNNWNNEVL